MEDLTLEQKILDAKLNWLAHADPKKFKETFINTIIEEVVSSRVGIKGLGRDEYTIQEIAEEQYEDRRGGQVHSKLKELLDFRIDTTRKVWLIERNDEEGYIKDYVDIEGIKADIERGVDGDGNIILNPDAYMVEATTEAREVFGELRLDKAESAAGGGDTWASDWYDEDLDQGQGMYLSDGMYLKADGTLVDTKSGR